MIQIAQRQAAVIDGNPAVVDLAKERDHGDEKNNYSTGIPFC